MKEIDSYIASDFSGARTRYIFALGSFLSIDGLSLQLSAAIGDLVSCFVFLLFFFPLLFLTMHTTHNYRHSRRSACDRCRGQKLRCERDHLNGMSCERCLKAQEICTTSMNQPAPIILPSNHGQNLLAREDHQSERFNQRHGSMSVLHKSSAPRVKKIHDPFPNSGRLNMQDHYWGGGGSMPALPGGSLYLPSADIGFNMPLDFGNIIPPAEQWCNPHFNWPTDAYNLVSWN
jgi:hypothetical protein